MNPGWRDFTVAPQTLGVRSAAGKLPTTHGAVHIEWQFDNDDLLTLLVQAPAHLNGTVFLPQPLLTPSNETIFIVDDFEQDGPFKLKNGRVFVQQMRR